MLPRVELVARDPVLVIGPAVIVEFLADLAASFTLHLKVAYVFVPHTRANLVVPLIPAALASLRGVVAGVPG